MTPDQLDPILAWARTTLLPVLFIVLVALIAMRLASVFVRGLVRTLLDREATEGTAQELSAAELKKRMDTLDALADPAHNVLHRA